ncbi:MAG: NAD(P)H-hydrate dehydratase [Chloroflexota bacterium]
MKVLTTEQMRQIEARTISNGATLQSLMRLAGEAIAGAAQARAPRGNVLVLAGPGNNGGDGLLAAGLLAAMGRRVRTYTFGRPDVEGSGAQDAEHDADLDTLRAWLDSSEIAVDALLGIGQNRPVEGALARIVSATNRAHLFRLAADISTGINADTGQVLGTALRANATLAMGFLKRGSVLPPGRSYSGRLQVAPLGMNRGLVGDIDVLAPSASEAAALLPKRPEDSNKGSFGRLLVVAGSQDFLGAPALACLAAARSGAGLVELAAITSVRQAVASHMVEAVYRTVPERDGHIAAEAAEGILRAQKSAVVLGPGLGQSRSVVDLTHSVVKALPGDCPVVVDADGLNALSRIPDWWQTTAALVLTPHPGEMSRLTGIDIADIQTNRLEVARSFARTWAQIVVLKGAGTVVANPDGRVSVNTTGEANLATAGTGDVLSGIVGGLLAQGLDPWDAAVAGVYWHGAAGDLIAEALGDAGTLASDLPPALPRARKIILEEADS